MCIRDRAYSRLRRGRRGTPEHTKPLEMPELRKLRHGGQPFPNGCLLYTSEMQKLLRRHADDKWPTAFASLVHRERHSDDIKSFLPFSQGHGNSVLGLPILLTLQAFEPQTMFIPVPPDQDVYKRQRRHHGSPTWMLRKPPLNVLQDWAGSRPVPAPSRTVYTPSASSVWSWHSPSTRRFSRAAQEFSGSRTSSQPW